MIVPATLTLAAMAGLILTYAFHLWMIRRGVIAWGQAPTTTPRSLAWYWKGMLMLLSLGVMTGAFFLASKIA